MGPRGLKFHLCCMWSKCSIFDNKADSIWLDLNSFIASTITIRWLQHEIWRIYTHTFYGKYILDLQYFKRGFATASCNILRFKRNRWFYFYKQWPDSLARTSTCQSGVSHSHPRSYTGKPRPWDGFSRQKSIIYCDCIFQLLISILNYVKFSIMKIIIIKIWCGDFFIYFFQQLRMIKFLFRVLWIVWKSMLYINSVHFLKFSYFLQGLQEFLWPICELYGFLTWLGEMLFFV